jgi:hypothetical protein
MTSHAPALRFPAFVLLAAALLLALPAQAQWKWRDGRGQIHISDLPPPRDIPEKDVLQKADPTGRKPPPAPAASPSDAAAAAAKPSTDPELEAKRRLAEQEQAAKKKADDDKLAAQRKENCRRAQEHLALLDSGQRVMRVNASGEREYLDDNTRAAEAKRTREVVASDCR